MRRKFLNKEIMYNRVIIERFNENEILKMPSPIENLPSQEEKCEVVFDNIKLKQQQ